MAEPSIRWTYRPMAPTLNGVGRLQACTLLASHFPPHTQDWENMVQVKERIYCTFALLTCLR